MKLENEDANEGTLRKLKQKKAEALRDLTVDVDTISDIWLEIIKMEKRIRKAKRG